tara:strand:- start:602 stop:925 length:324 start_codon:yes stop_codon:yes gene_type:complete
MKGFELILYTRSGCCLCEGLEEKLKSIPLEKLSPELQFVIKNIDGDSVTNLEKRKYSMEVPVLVFRLYSDRDLNIDLPRVSPRLTKEDLFRWLKKMLYEKIHIEQDP